MNSNLTSTYGLDLSDGASWTIQAQSHATISFIEQLAEIMKLCSPNGNGRNLNIEFFNNQGSDPVGGSLGGSLKLLVTEVLEDYPWEEECYLLKKNISYHLKLEGNETLNAVQFIQFSSIFALDVVTRGGLLIHGALIEQDGRGIILAGPGGVGKTTACNRLPDNWHMLSDDAALLVRDGRGCYWAHPWPTWSRFLEEKVGGSWDVGRGVKLGAICFLSQSAKMELTPMGEGEMVCVGMECTEQASRALGRELDEKMTRKLKNLYFRNICQMAKTVPGYRLHLDLYGSFWELIEDLTISIASEVHSVGSLTER